MCPPIVFYLPEDGYVVGRNVYIKEFQYTCVH